MRNAKSHFVAAACIVALTLLAMPAESQAGPILDWLCGCKSVPAQTGYYAPYSAPAYAPAYAPYYAPAPAAGCAPCAPQTVRYAPQTVHYVPQTCYRTVYQPAAVASCVPTTSYNPCTGGAVTTYRVATSYGYQVQLVPYTTYAAAYSVPSTTYAGCAPSAPCSTCTNYSPGVVETAAPLMTAPATGAAPASTSSPSGTTSPDTGSGPSTFQRESKPSTDSAPKPIPGNGTKWNSPPAGPLLNDAEGRTAARWTDRPGSFQLISSPPQAQPPVLNDGGWRVPR